MNEEQLRNRIQELSISKNTQVVFCIIENQKDVAYNGRVEFLENGFPAISKGKVGIRIQMVKGADDMPYVGGLDLNNLVSIELA
ncbi:MAG: hypothetical protein KA841_00150 [Chitinophagales bacterium]|jgi:hypothetical protein|nr:hypothetical protein [Chitinophagales bacterium]